MRRTGVLVLGLGLLLGGCVSRVDNGEVLPAQEPGSVEELVVNTPGFATVPDGMREVSGDDADLRGPHFMIDIDWIAVGSMIKEKPTPSVPELTARRAADGQELLLVSVTSVEIMGQFPAGDAKPVAELVVDGERTPLPSLPLPQPADGVPVSAEGVMITASVPRGASAELAVTDEGRSQSVDLRTGKRFVAIDRYYGRAATLVVFNTDIPLTFPGGSVTLHAQDHAMAEIDPKVAMLAPWTPGQGWAADGRVWLMVPRPVLSTPLLNDMYGLQLAVDDAAVFAVDGRPEVGGTHQFETLAGEFLPVDDSQLVFDVPAEFAHGVFTMNIAAMDVTVMFFSGYRNVTLSPPPTPLTVSLSFN
jgi:hypothetical protein